MADVSATFSTEEWELPRNALKEILHGPEAIEEWEFSTRTGAPRDRAEALLRRMAKLPYSHRPGDLGCRALSSASVGTAVRAFQAMHPAPRD